MQGRSPEPCRRRDCPAQTGWPYRRARWKALRHAVGVTHLQDHELAGKVRGRAFEGVPQTAAVDPSRSLSFASERLFLPQMRPSPCPTRWDASQRVVAYPWLSCVRPRSEQCEALDSERQHPDHAPQRSGTRSLYGMVRHGTGSSREWGASPPPEGRRADQPGVHGHPQNMDAIMST